MMNKLLYTDQEWKVSYLVHSLQNDQIIYLAGWTSKWQSFEEFHELLWPIGIIEYES